MMLSEEDDSQRRHRLPFFYATCASNCVRRRREAMPTAPKPISIMAQVAGSGTAQTFRHGPDLMSPFWKAQYTWTCTMAKAWASEMGRKRTSSVEA